jgi:hypothetical protein
MAGSSMTFTYDDGVDAANTRGSIRKVIGDWVSDDSAGTASGTTRKIVGELIKLVTDPGSTAPTDNYDIAIADEEGANVLGSIQNATALGTRDTANTEETYLHLLNADNTPIGIAAYPVVCDKLTISIANAGNSKTGQFILYYRV